MKILYLRAPVSQTSAFVLVERAFMCTFTKTSFYDRRKIFIVGGTLFMNIVVVLILWSAKTIRRPQKTFRLQAKLCWWPTMEHFLSIEPKIDNTTRRNSDNVHSARTTDFASGCWWAHLSKRHQRRWYFRFRRWNTAETDSLHSQWRKFSITIRFSVGGRFFRPAETSRWWLVVFGWNSTYVESSWMHPN